MIDNRVHCSQCRAALESLPVNEHGFPLAGAVYDVGSHARPEMGHAMYFAGLNGRVALCVAPRINREVEC